MSRFQLLVADDEPLARTMVADLLKRDPDVATVVECGDAPAVQKALAAGHVDIAFLDIEMPQVSGIEIARHLTADGPIVVFVTAFGHYAATAFEVKAIDYVLKPFSDARLLEALDRAKRRVRERRLGQLADQLAVLSNELKETSPASDPERTPQQLTFRDGDRSTVLDSSEVIWIEAEDYYVLIHSTRGRHMVRASLTALEQRLDGCGFVRAHRNALVNLDAVASTRDGGQTLVLSNGASVPVSRSRRAQVELRLRARPGPPSLS